MSYKYKGDKYDYKGSQVYKNGELLFTLKQDPLQKFITSVFQDGHKRFDMIDRDQLRGRSIGYTCCSTYFNLEHQISNRGLGPGNLYVSGKGNGFAFSFKPPQDVGFWVIAILILEKLEEREMSQERSRHDSSSSSDSGPRLTKNEKAGNSPLLIAAGQGDGNRVRSLLRDGADPNHRNNSNYTPLHAAAKSGNDSVVSMLLKAGASLNCQTSANRTPLIIAVENGHDSIVSILLDAGADPNIKGNLENTALLLAVVSGHKAMINALLAAGANPNITNFDGTCPLIEAIKKGDEPLVKALLKAGADPNVGDDNGMTSLHMAVLCGGISLTRLILKSGVDPNIGGDGGKTPLHIAAEKKNADYITLLVKAGGDPNRESRDKSTPLHIAASGTNLENVKRLVKAGADVNHENNEKNTPLHNASIKSESMPIYVFLIQNGADPYHKNENGKSPEDIKNEREHAAFKKSMKWFCKRFLVVLFVLVVIGIVIGIICANVDDTERETITPSIPCGVSFYIAKEDNSYIKIFLLGDTLLKVCNGYAGSNPRYCTLYRGDLKDEKLKLLIANYSATECTVKYYDRVSFDDMFAQGAEFPKEIKYWDVCSSKNCKGCKKYCIEYHDCGCKKQNYDYYIIDSDGRIVSYAGSTPQRNVTYNPAPSLEEFALDESLCNGTFPKPTVNPCSAATRVELSVSLVVFLCMCIFQVLAF